MDRICGRCALSLCQRLAATRSPVDASSVLRWSHTARYSENSMVISRRGCSSGAAVGSSSRVGLKQQPSQVRAIQSTELSANNISSARAAAPNSASPSTKPAPSSGKTKKAGKKNAEVFTSQHLDIIKMLHKRRHQLKARIRQLRERERTEKSNRTESKIEEPGRKGALVRLRDPAVPLKSALVPTSSASQTALLPFAPEGGRDGRLDLLAALQVRDPDYLEQDHLSNVSDFRLSLASSVSRTLPAAKPISSPAAPAVGPRKTARWEASSAVAAASWKQQEALAAEYNEKRRVEARMRPANLKNLNSTLKAYILACTHADMASPAVGAFMFYRDKYPDPADRAIVLDLDVCNLLMNLFAKKGRMDRIKEIFHWMRSDRIKPDAQSFALALETLGRQPTLDLKTARRIARQMTEEKISFQVLFEQCRFVLDEKEKVLEVIRQMQPGWKMVPIRRLFPYEPEILRCLNQRPTSTLMDTPYRGVTKPEQWPALLSEQLKREMHSVVRVRSVDAPLQLDAKTAACRLVWEQQKETWKQVLTKAFERGKEVVKNHTRNQRAVNIYPLLCALKPEDYVDILVEEVVRLAQGSEGYSPSTMVLDMLLGQKVMNKYLVECKQKYGIVNRLESVYKEYFKYFDNPAEITQYNCREKWQKVEEELQLTKYPTLSDHVWSKALTVRLGKFLNDIIVNEVKIDVNCMRIKSVEPQYTPAVFKLYKERAKELCEELRPHPLLVRLYKAASPDTLTFETTMCPTIVPPLPWTEVRSGGYLLQHTVLTRLPEMAIASDCVVARAPAPQLYPVFDALNQLGASPWIINKPMLDLVISIFRNKGMPDVDIPAPVSDCLPLPKLTQGMSNIEKMEVFRERFRLKRRKNEMFSLWCDALYKLSIANHFRDSVFYFPHNIDFRGRVYPVPPHFQHLGGDMTRSLLLFAKGMPLGEKGLDWLKIHLINLTGLKKKCSIAERLAYANEIMDDILDSADNPLTGRQWWKSSDDPWQSLACCKEIANASRSPDHRCFVSHFPIHQDGSCNGLQHYAALGRDSLGAHQVNLAPAPVPQDVYSGVAALVEEERRQDAERGIEVAKALDGFVGRKVVKQTVMTIVYGVTRYGARQQIHGQLADLRAFDQEKSWPGASYLAGKTFDSIRQMFTATRQIQEWFVECARLISTVRERPIQWVTPLQLPVLQPYFKQTKQHQKSRQTLHLSVDKGKINTMKQKNAFPPNFIHSLDSTHMMLTCLHSARAGISFVSVHDSYWTHPISVDIMNKLCREQFVAMHSLPILDDLSRYLVKEFAFDQAEVANLPPDSSPVILNKTLQHVPAKGDFDLSSVLRSVYFFS
ncbi:DNA-directed RNA polymerase, mitochondrial-like [Paramacrobiotus metropolitanus]|uniref:DNA-directed RNA polymerase, mitochondrial-like n=1 Tax=Paramacrobiotus metropolitanus TaxID=2943436 RepID=UPI002445F764|nr:DNA-directed RNA polymerase, mitochondrial-like [Paramacrobiotus metropolitanus]